MPLPPEIPNPFLGTVVADPWAADGIESDVPQIHAEVFDECCRAVEEIRAGGRSSGILIHGQAGSGKTHLLRRLRARFASPATPSTDPERPRQVFASIRLQTSPGMIWRHVRRRCAEDLLRSSGDEICQLDQLLRYRMAEFRPAIGHLDLWWDYLWDEHPQAIDELLGHFSQHDGMDYATTTVLEHFLRGTHRRETLGWLRGEPLPQSALDELGLKAADEETADPEAEARATVRAFCALAGAEVPVILCFDQVESLQSDPEDKAGLFAFGQLVAALHDETRNVLLVSCMQSSFAESLHKTIREADYDRIGSRAKLALPPLRHPQAAQLVKARLDGSRELAPLRAGRDPLWPLNDSDLRAAVGDLGCTPRELLKACAERFFVLQRGAPVPALAIEEFLRRDWEGRLEKAVAENRPEETESILGHGLPYLMSIAAPDWQRQEKDSRLRDVDFVYAAPRTEARVGISLCTHGSMTSLAARLRRLREQFAQGRLEKLVLLRDPRTPIGAGAKRAHDYLRELETQGATLLRPSVEALAALEALRLLLSDAQSGDLTAAGETVPPQTVRDWLAAHLPSTLRELAETVTACPRPGEFDGDGPGAADGRLERLTELLSEQHLTTIDEAAARFGCDPASLEAAVRTRPHQFVLLAGPPAVVFERVESATPARSGSDLQSDESA
ncbi:MAG: hypothetical protein WD069_05855 [Planctomycetales bacterium]